MCKPLAQKEPMKIILKGVLKNITEDRRWVGQGDFDGHTNKANHAMRGLISSHLIMVIENEGYTVSKYDVAKTIIYSSVKKSLGEIAKDTKAVIFDYLDLSDGDAYMKANAFTWFRRRATPEAAKELFFNTGKFEKNIADVAGILASYAELQELRDKLDVIYFSRKEREILASLDKYRGTVLEKAINQALELMPLYVEVAAKLRVQNRWKNQLAPCNCSVLAHLFDAGVIAFFNMLELTDDLAETGKGFFMGIYHDLIEYLTGDIPSPLKDNNQFEIVVSYMYIYDITFSKEQLSQILLLPAQEQVTEFTQIFTKHIGKVPKEVADVFKLLNEGKTIRTATEYAEDFFLEKYYYAALPQYMVEVTKELMFEAPENAGYFPIIKAADYLAAILECDCQYDKGSSNYYFQKATNSTIEGIKAGKYKVGPNLLEIFKEIQEEDEVIWKSSRNQLELEVAQRKINELEEKIRELKKSL